MIHRDEATWVMVDESHRWAQVVWNRESMRTGLFFLLLGPNIETLFKGLAHFLSLQDAFYLFLCFGTVCPLVPCTFIGNELLSSGLFSFTVMLNRAHDQSVANLESRHRCWKLFPMKHYRLVLKKVVDFVFFIYNCYNVLFIWVNSSQVLQ